jgi:hypothetical protein
MSDSESESSCEEVVVAATKPVRKSSRFQKLVEETTVKRKEKSSKASKKEPLPKPPKAVRQPEPDVTAARRDAIAPTDTNAEMMKMIFSLQQQLAQSQAHAQEVPKRKASRQDADRPEVSSRKASKQVRQGLPDSQAYSHRKVAPSGHPYEEPSRGRQPGPKKPTGVKREPSVDSTVAPSPPPYVPPVISLPQTRKDVVKALFGF